MPATIGMRVTAGIPETDSERAAMLATPWMPSTAGSPAVKQQGC